MSEFSRVRITVGNLSAERKEKIDSMSENELREFSSISGYSGETKEYLLNRINYLAAMREADHAKQELAIANEALNVSRKANRISFAALMVAFVALIASLMNWGG